MRPIEIEWVNDPKLAGAATRFFVENLTRDYISMGEFISGRALPQVGWRPDLAVTIENELSEVLRDSTEGKIFKRLALVRRETSLLGLAVVAFTRQEGFSHAVLEDLIVRGDLRREGIGVKLLDWIENEVVRLGVRYLTLESGVENRSAQRFFRRRGYRVITTVRLKDLSPS